MINNRIIRKPYDDEGPLDIRNTPIVFQEEQIVTQQEDQGDCETRKETVIEKLMNRWRAKETMHARAMLKQDESVWATLQMYNRLLPTGMMYLLRKTALTGQLIQIVAAEMVNMTNSPEI